MTDFSKLAAAMNKRFGEDDDDDGVSCWLSTGYIELDRAISGSWDGGLPGGRIVEIFGPPSAGKTWLATQVMISAQKMGGYAVFDDHERSFKRNVARSMGLNIDAGQFKRIKSESYEQSITNFIKTTADLRAMGLPQDAPIVWVFDSLASMVPQQKLAKDATELNMNDTTALARLTSSTFPAVSQIAEKHNVLVLVLNQVRTKPGVVYGDPTTSPGGEAPKFYASVRIQLGATRLMKDEGGEKVMIGQEVTARCVKNKVSRPYVKAKWRFLFGDDGVGRFAVTDSLIEFAVEKKLLETAGAYVVWQGGKFHRGALAKKLDSEGKLQELIDLIKGSGVAPDEETAPEEAA